MEQAFRLSGLQFTKDSGEVFLHRKGKQGQLEHRQHLEPACLTELELGLLLWAFLFRRNLNPGLYHEQLALRFEMSA